jgi:hypothetical protein
MTPRSDPPLAIDMFCGLGGWTEGLLAEGWRVVGFDIERHVYGEARYPAQLVLQDVLTIHGRQFATADLIVASPPCQAYSYRAMPWKRAKALPPPDNSLFEACFRIQREACAVACRYIPLVVENVRGAQPWVGRAKWHFGSFYLWGDVPALMPLTKKHVKVPTMGAGWYPPGHPKHVRGLAFNGHADRNLREDGIKAGDRNKGRAAGGHKWDTGFDVTLGREGVKQRGSGREWFAGDGKISRLTSSKSPARKAASAHIAKIPFVLAQHIAQVYHPRHAERTA